MTVPTPQAEALRLADELEAVVADVKASSDRAYCDYIEQLRRPECLGFEHKLKTGTFGTAELAAHNRARELLGRHRALADALVGLRRLHALTTRAPDAGWVKVCERLPEKNVEVLIAFRDVSLPATGQYTASPHDTWGWSFPGENDPDDTGPIIAWQPLPEHPTMGGPSNSRDPWLPLESAPKDGTRVILAWGGKSINGYHLDNSNTARPWQGWRVESMVVQPAGSPTAWQPFPAPPAPEALEVP